MNRKTFRLGLCLLIVIGAASLSPVRAGLRDNNLIEFSRGSYGNMSVKAMLWPPFVKIYQDGKVIHFDSEEKKFYLSRLAMLDRNPGFLNNASSTNRPPPAISL